MTLLGQKTVSDVQEGDVERSDREPGSSLPHNHHNIVLECAFSVLAFAFADPVYKVFVAGLVRSSFIRYILLRFPDHL